MGRNIPAAVGGTRGRGPAPRAGGRAQRAGPAAAARAPGTRCTRATAVQGACLGVSHPPTGRLSSARRTARPLTGAQGPFILHPGGGGSPSGRRGLAGAPLRTPRSAALTLPRFLPCHWCFPRFTSAPAAIPTFHFGTCGKSSFPIAAHGPICPGAGGQRARLAAPQAGGRRGPRVRGRRERQLRKYLV